MSNSFALKNIKVNNFRNYEDCTIYNFSDINIFVGPNAVGKTNLIEAIQLITQLSSFRKLKIHELINSQNISNHAKISANIKEKFGDTQEKLLSNNYICLTIVDGKKEYKLNEKKRKISELKGLYPSVIFTPDDLTLVKGSNLTRRSAFDILGSQISKEYYTVLSDFKRILRQKNKSLQESAQDETINSINDIFIITSAQLSYFRMGLVNKISPLINSYYKEISNSKEKLRVSYYPSWNLEESNNEFSRNFARETLSKCIQLNLAKENVMGKSLFGAQRDHIRFFIDNKDALKFASQGQQRSIVLAYKLAEVKLIESMINKKPILLLDDVMSELDEDRRNKLLDLIQDKTQIFITTTNLDYFNKEFLEIANVIRLKRC